MYTTSTTSSLITEQPLRSLFAPSWSRRTTKWPDSERSSGRELEPLDKSHKCWEIIGPVLDLSTRILSQVRELLNERHACLTEAEPIIAPVVFGLYMTGRRKEQSSPVLLFSCIRPLPRRRAKELVKESRILANYPAIRLADSKRPPQALELLKILGGETGSWANNTERHENGVQYIYCLPMDTRASGFPVLTKNKSGGFRKTTIGGIVVLSGKYYGLTAAHPFFESRFEGDREAESDPSDMECEFDTESESSGNEPDVLSNFPASYEYSKPIARNSQTSHGQDSISRPFPPVLSSRPHPTSLGVYLSLLALIVANEDR